MDRLFGFVDVRDSAMSVFVITEQELIMSSFVECDQAKQCVVGTDMERIGDTCCESAEMPPVLMLYASVIYR